MALGSTLASDEVRARREVRPRGTRPASGRIRVTPSLARVQALMGQGLPSKEIASHLGLTEATAKIYMCEVRSLTGKSTREIVFEHRSIAQGDADGEPRMGAFE